MRGLRQRWRAYRKVQAEHRGATLARWRAELRASPVLRLTAALTLAMILAAVLFVSGNPGELGNATNIAAAAFIIVVGTLYTRALLLSTARATEGAGAGEPEARRPRLELAALLVYWLYIFGSEILAGKGRWGAIFAWPVTRVKDFFGSGLLRSPLAPAEREWFWHVLVGVTLSALLPLLGLLLAGNTVRSLGFHRPRGRWWLPLTVGAIFPLVLAALGPPRSGPSSPGAEEIAFTVTAYGVLGGLLTVWSEEVFYRAGLQTRLHVLTGSRPLAVLLAAWLFALVHLIASSERSLPQFAQNVLVRVPNGIMWGYLYSRTGSLLPPVLLHLIWNLCMGPG